MSCAVICVRGGGNRQAFRGAIARAATGARRFFALRKESGHFSHILHFRRTSALKCKVVECHGCLSGASLLRLARHDPGRRKRLNALLWPSRAPCQPENEPEFSILRKCPEYPGAKATPRPHQCHIKATSRLIDSQAIGTPKPPQATSSSSSPSKPPTCDPKATTKRQQSHPRAKEEGRMKNAERAGAISGG